MTAAAEKPGSTLTQLIHWAPALLLVLYVIGYIAANTHYSRYEPVKADLLSARYLAAGLLWVAFGGVPGTAGYLGGLEALSLWRTGKKRWVVVPTLSYLALGGIYSALLGAATLVDLALRWSMVWMFTLAALTGIQLAILPRMRYPLGVPGRAFLIIGTGVVLVMQTYIFGSRIYPWVEPQYGGAAVRKGYVELKPDASQGLHYALRDQPLPLFDLDDNFLYVLACRKESTSNRPETTMIPLEAVANMGISSSGYEFVALPAYVADHYCGRVEVKK
jgi:hypothetical protein